MQVPPGPQTSGSTQVPQVAPHPSSPHVFPSHVGWHGTQRPPAHWSVPAQVPQVPPQPSAPQFFPSQARVQHFDSRHTWPAPHSPHFSPQKSPHSMPSHDGFAGQPVQSNPHSWSQAAAQNASQCSVQQVGYFAQTQASQPHPPQPGASPATQAAGSGRHCWIPGTHVVPGAHAPHEKPFGSVPQVRLPHWGW